jgi:protein-S-isoprenylcysteine O-methyltransferase Ste14
VDLKSSLKIMGTLCVNVALAAIWGLFAYAHYLKFLATHAFYLIPYIILESLTALMFLARKAVLSHSTNYLEWLIALVGTIVPMLMRPSEVALLPRFGAILTALGACIQCICLASLNRSFGVVPANRGVKTDGMYRCVRHPLYVGYLIVFTGYILVNSSLLNVGIYLTWFLCTLARIKFEERHLGSDVAYQQYQRSVRWKLVPFVF